MAVQAAQSTAQTRESAWPGNRWRRHFAGALIGIGALLSVLLLAPRSGQAQGNPAALIRQMQARLSALTVTIQRQQQQITAINNQRVAEQRQMQQLQQAVNAAAAAGDPTALAIRSPSAQLVVEKLTTQFQARAHTQPAAGAAGGSNMFVADLSGAHLPGALLQGAKLAKVNLSGADLTHADLTHAVLAGADLQGAKLQGANLTAVDLSGANLTDALYNSQTHWPTGFDPSQHGALNVK